MSKVGNLKILVIGDVEGRFSTIFSKIEAINQKNGPFEMVLCVGSFFGDNNTEWDALQRCTITVPLPTFILGPTFPEHIGYFKSSDGGDLVPNLTFLGKRGIYTFSTGLKVAYLSGTESMDPDASSDLTFNLQDVEEVVTLAGGNSSTGVDILLTSQWAADVETHGNPAKVESSKFGSSLIAQLAVALKPRYHFAGLADSFYERTPYRNHEILSEAPTHVTRFIGMASVGNDRKEKFLYAFNIIPIPKLSLPELRKQPDICTACPFERKPIRTKKEKAEDIIAHQYFYDTVSAPEDSRKRKGQFQERNNKRPADGEQHPPAPCWFCLSSPDAEKHLVVSVGLHTYVALAKGGLTPDHLLVLPIFHLRSYPELDDEAAAEIDRYKTALKQYFFDHGRSVVFFERNFKSKHMQLQVVPVPKTDPEKVKSLFLEHAEASQLKLTEIPSKSDVRQMIKPGLTFFYVELENGDKMFYKIDQKGFPLQFGRDVCADRELLNMPDRVDWRECYSTREQETKWASTFKEAFKSYDFNFS